MDALYDKNQPYPFDYFFEESMRNKMDHTGKPSPASGRGLEDHSDSSSLSSNEEEGSSDEEEESMENDHTHN